MPRFCDHRSQTALFTPLRALPRPLNALSSLIDGFIKALKSIIKTLTGLYKALEGLIKALEVLIETLKGVIEALKKELTKKALKGLGEVPKGLFQSRPDVKSSVIGPAHAKKQRNWNQNLTSTLAKYIQITPKRSAIRPQVSCFCLYHAVSCYA